MTSKGEGDVGVRLAKLMMTGEIEVSKPQYPGGLLKLLMGEKESVQGKGDNDDPEGIRLRALLEPPLDEAARRGRARWDRADLRQAGLHAPDQPQPEHGLHPLLLALTARHLGLPLRQVLASGAKEPLLNSRLFNAARSLPSSPVPESFHRYQRGI